MWGFHSQKAKNIIKSIVTPCLLDSTLDDIFPAFCIHSLHFILVFYGTFIMFNDSIFESIVVLARFHLVLLILSIRMTYFSFLHLLCCVHVVMFITLSSWLLGMTTMRWLRMFFTAWLRKV